MLNSLTQRLLLMSEEDSQNLFFSVNMFSFSVIKTILTVFHHVKSNALQVYLLSHLETRLDTLLYTTVGNA